MRMRSMTALCAVFTLVACGDDSAGLAPRDAGTLVVRLSQTATAAANELSAAQARDDVRKVMVTVNAISALRDGGSDNVDSDWVRTVIEPAITIDLMDLPVDGEGALSLSRADFDDGSYRSLRLHVSRATIEFTTDVQVGPRSWVAGEAHELRIPPQTEQSRITIPSAAFIIRDGEATVVDLVLQPGTSVQSIAATPNFILMAPVLLTKPRD